MKTKFFLFFLLAVYIVGLSSAKPQGSSADCGENAEFTTCGNICPQRCGVRQRFCSLRCFAGCQCKSGYLLNKENKCVLQKDC